MKKINELVTRTEKPEHKAKRRAVTFGSFKRAEEKQIAERKEREHQAELARIAENARIQRAIADEEARVIKEENTRKRNELITKKLSNAFGTKTDVDFKPVREQVIDKYLPKIKEPETLDDYPKPFEAEPALNAELAEFKKKINEHLHKVGFATSSGGGAGSFADLDDVDPTTAKVDGKTIQFDSSTNKFVGADVTAGALAADNLTAGDSAINLTTTAGNITIDAQGNNTDIIFKGTDGSSDTTFLTIDGGEAGAATFNDKIVATELDISGNVDVDGTLEADAITVDGTTLAEYISDTAGAMFSSNTETGISATYQDADNTIDLELAAAQTSITSILATDLKIGEDDETKIDFETANEIHFYAANVEQVYLGDNVFGPESDSDVDLGTTGVRWKDAYIDTITTTGNASVGGDITITGDLTVNGDTTTVNTATLSVEDPLIILASGNNSADSIDFGFYGLYDTSGSQDLYAGLFRDANDSGKFKLFKDLQAAPTTTVNTGGTGYATATLVANLEGDVTGNITVSDGGTISSATTSGLITLYDDSVRLTNTGTSDSNAVLQLYSADSGSGSAPDMYFWRNSSSPADDDYLGKIIYYGENSASEGTAYVTESVRMKDVTNGTEDGSKIISVMSNGSYGSYVFDYQGLSIPNGFNIGSTSDLDAMSISSGGVVNFTQSPTVSSAAVLVAGLQTIWIPASAMRPTASNGCAEITDVETTSGRPDMQVLDFDASSDEHAQFQIGFPKSWNEGTITFRVFWTSTATDTDGVAWALQGVSVANDATIDVAYGTAVVVTDDNISAAEDCLVTATSGNVTIASAAADTLTYFRIYRDIDNANDDMAEDARLLGIQLFYTTDAANDA